MMLQASKLRHTYQRSLAAHADLGGFNHEVWPGWMRSGAGEMLVFERLLSVPVRV